MSAPRRFAENRREILNWPALHQKSCKPSSLCNLCVLCVSVVDEFRAKTHHRDPENTEVAQKSMCSDFLCKAKLATTPASEIVV